MLGAFITGFIILAGMNIYNMINDKQIEKKIDRLQEFCVDNYANEPYKINTTSWWDTRNNYVDAVAFPTTVDKTRCRYVECGQDGRTINN